MSSEIEMRFEKGMKDPNWAGWFSSIPKRDLWIDLVSENERLSEFYKDKIERLEAQHKIEMRETSIQHKAASFCWFILGGIAGSTTGFLSL